MFCVHLSLLEADDITIQAQVKFEIELSVFRNEKHGKKTKQKFIHLPLLIGNY